MSLCVVLSAMTLSSCQMQKRVTIPSGGQLVARSVVVKEEPKVQTVIKEEVAPVVKEEVQETVKEEIKPVVIPEVKPQPVAVQEVPVVSAPVVEEKVITEVEVPKVEVKVRQETFSVVDKSDEVVAKKNFHIVVGSFGKQDNATRLRSSLAAQGYAPIVVVNEAGMYRVIIISCETYDEAQNAIHKVRTTYPDAWVLAQK